MARPKPKKRHLSDSGWVDQEKQVDFSQVEERLSEICGAHPGLFGAIKLSFEALQNTVHTWDPEAPTRGQVKEALERFRTATVRLVGVFHKLDEDSLDQLKKQNSKAGGKGLKSWGSALDEMHLATTLALRELEASSPRTRADVQVCYAIANWMAEDGLEPSLPGPGGSTTYLQICMLLLEAFGVEKGPAKYASEEGLKLHRKTP